MTLWQQCQPKQTQISKNIGKEHRAYAKAAQGQEAVHIVHSMEGSLGAFK